MSVETARTRKTRGPDTIARPLLSKLARAGLRKVERKITLTAGELKDVELVRAVQWLRDMAEFYEREDVKERMREKAALTKTYKATRKGTGEHHGYQIQN